METILTVQNVQQRLVYYTFLTFVIMELPGSVPVSRASAYNVDSTHFQSCVGGEQDIVQGTELVMSQFKLHPIYRIYFYFDGDVPAQIIVVVEINLPSGVGPGM